MVLWQRRVAARYVLTGGSSYARAMSITDDDVVERCEKLLADHRPARHPTVEFLGAQFDAGLAWVHFPEGYGGLGASPQAAAGRQRAS